MAQQKIQQFASALCCAGAKEIVKNYQNRGTIVSQKINGVQRLKKGGN
jgi:hypothetical protein